MKSIRRFNDKFIDTIIIIIIIIINIFNVA